MKKDIETLAREQIGDGKRPNKFWLSVSSDYSYFHIDEDGVAYIDYIGDIIPEWEENYSEGKLVSMYKTLDEAIDCADDDFYIGMKYEGFIINRITIEDRMVGTIWERELIFDPKTGRTWNETRNDSRLLK